MAEDFRRGLDESFLTMLARRAKEDWLAGALADPDLILGIRDNYVNLYFRGQSLFKIERDSVTTHPKYLVDPDMQDPVRFDGARFAIEGRMALMNEYGPQTPGKMKRAAAPYAGDEKTGVQAVIRHNPDVIDTEIAFGGGRTVRADLACLERGSDGIVLRFWEAKCFDNPELRAKEGDAPVAEQMRTYGALLREHYSSVLESYCRVAHNLVEIEPLRGTPVGDLIRKVANGEPLGLADPPVGLIIFHFDQDQRDGARWATHIGKLEGEFPIRAAGDPANIRLAGRRSAYA